MNKITQEEINLRWLAKMFPLIEKPEDKSDKISNVIHIYCTAGADLIDKLTNKKYKVITLCGSTKFKDEFIDMQKLLTLQGNIVLTVGLFGHSGDDEVWEPGVKEKMDDMHKQRIDMSDEIFVINVNGYIGESTKAEIEYAKSKGKKN
jgi:hypothetical protein